MTKLRVDVWSDIACPWCYVGKRRLEAALEGFDQRDDVEVVWRAFELDPSAPQELPSQPPYVERLARKYRTNSTDAQAMIDRMTSVAAADGLEFRFDRIRPGNTFNAHRLIHFARQHHLQDALKERLLAAYLCEGEPIGDSAMLARQAEAVGLDRGEAMGVLSSDAFAEEVRREEQDARELGISGVPFFLIDGRLAVSGAQSAELLGQALAQAWRERTPELSMDDGAVCGPAGCT